MNDLQRWAAVCSRGHVHHSHLTAELLRMMETVSNDLGRSLHSLPPFCGRCGARIILACRTCEAPILGQRADSFLAGWSPASFCWRCGSPYPWATREQRIGQLYNLLDEEDLDEPTRLAAIEQLAILAEPIDEAAEERQVRAGKRLRKLVPGLWEGAMPIIQSVLTTAAKQKLGLPS